jgi:MOSC domain-containing protein YiiM
MDGVTPETCDECGFDARAWKVRDAASLLATTGTWWEMALEGGDPVDLNRRPAPGVWSVLEYGVHTALVVAMIRAGTELIMATDGLALPAIPEGGDASADDAVAELDPAAVVADLAREGHAIAAFAKAADKASWTNTGTLPDGTVIQAAALYLHAAHDASHHQMDVARGLAAIGAGAPAQTGRVMRVNASDGGVPKRSIGGADVSHAGLNGDRQADRKHHGRPFQALCLWSSDVIAELAADGHPIEAGAAGENVTVEGLDWSTLRPGTRIRIGSVLAELSFPATPCAKQTRWFADGDFGRIDHGRNPQWVRWYAWVREPGRVDEGDAVVVRP